MKDFLKYTLATIVGIFLVNIIGFFLLFIIVGAIMSTTEKQVIVSNNSMLVINLEKQVVDRAPIDPFKDLNLPGGFYQENKIGLDQVLKSIENAKHDERIKGLYLNSSVVNAGMATVEEIRNALLEFKNECGKPIYAYADFYGQKAYYLATVADTIALNPEGSVDFRGLGGEMMFYKKALEKLGVEMQIVRHGKFKSAVEPFMLEKMSAESKEQSMTYLNSLWGQMLKGISEERGISVEQLNKLADEVQTFNKGEKAVANGLVDVAIYKDQVLDAMRAITGIEANKGIPVIGVSDYADVYVRNPDKKKGYQRTKIAVIYASGDIGVSMGGDVINADVISREIRAARIDTNYKAIVLRIDSPGGSAYHSDVIWREVDLAAKEKTVVASMGDVAASGGYYIACAADKIVASPNTITGSIGIFGVIPNAGELLNEKLGITTDVVKTNKHSDLITVTRGMSEFERNMMQENIEEGYTTFITKVANGRNMEVAAIDEIGQGRVWSGENAKEIGLVDQFGGINEAIELAAEISGVEDYRIVNLPKQADPFEELFSTAPDKIRAWLLEKELGENLKYYNFLKKASQLKGVYTRMPYDIDIQ